MKGFLRSLGRFFGRNRQQVQPTKPVIVTNNNPPTKAATAAASGTLLARPRARTSAARPAACSRQPYLHAKARFHRKVGRAFYFLVFILPSLNYIVPSPPPPLLARAHAIVILALRR